MFSIYLPDGRSIDHTQGPLSVGRSEKWMCYSPRCSRNQCSLERDPFGLGVNPCVVYPKLLGKEVVVKKGDDFHLQNGDQFSLYPDSPDRYTLDVMPDPEEDSERTVEISPGKPPRKLSDSSTVKKGGMTFKDLKRKVNNDGSSSSEDARPKKKAKTEVKSAKKAASSSSEEIGSFFLQPEQKSFSGEQKEKKPEKSQKVEKINLKSGKYKPNQIVIPTTKKVEKKEDSDDEDPYGLTEKKVKKNVLSPANKAGYKWDALKGMVIAMTGTLSLKRDDFIQIIHDNGGTYANAITGKVTHLVCADPHKSTSKLDKAREKGIKVVSEDDLLAGLKKKSDVIGDDDGGDEEADDGGDNTGNEKVPKPLHHMDEGDSVPIKGAQYEIRLRGGIYYCTCTAWKMQNSGVDKRTCKHLREYLGEEFDVYRCGHKGMKAAKVEKTTAPQLLLANKWEENMDPTGWWMSEKLDGVRAYWNGKAFISRLGNKFYAPDFFTEDLPSDLELDGELFLERKKFNDTISIVKSQDLGPRWKNLKYHIFDVITLKDKPFEERYEFLKKKFPKAKFPYVKVVEQTKCGGKKDVIKTLAEVEAKGGEGLMLRQPKSKYVGTRSNTLLKVKSFFDDEALVVGYVEGKGKHKGRVGGLKCELINGLKFQVGTGLSDAQREKPPKVGSVITFRYQELTEGGIPRFPAYVGERIDVKWPKTGKTLPTGCGPRKAK